jgi:glycosyltransferase involved in cell wall biosynthesis
VKILFGMPAPDSWGGPAACEPPFVAALSSLGVECVTETYVYGDKGKGTNLIGRIVRVIRTAMRLRKLLSSTKFDLIQLNTAFDKFTVLRDAISIFLMGRNRPKIFLKIHGSGAHFINPRSLLYRPLIRYLDRQVTGYGIFTREELDTFLPHGIDTNKFHLVKNVVQIEGQALDDPEKKRRSGNFGLVFVSRFIETKGLLETLAAVKTIRDRGSDVSIVCVGDGPMKREAEQLVRKLEISDSVRFTGYIPETEVDRELAQADIFVFPTRHNEGFPIAMFKAAISGLPIVTTPVRAAAEYFEDHVNCLFCSPQPTDIADKIIELINNGRLRTQMREANLGFQELLSPPNIAREYFMIYQKLARDG